MKLIPGEIKSIPRGMSDDDDDNVEYYESDPHKMADVDDMSYHYEVDIQDDQPDPTPQQRALYDYLRKEEGSDIIWEENTVIT